jgi:hypothetical protein
MISSLAVGNIGRTHEAMVFLRINVATVTAETKTVG